MKILKNLSWIFGANLLVSLSKWMIIVIIAKQLSPEDVGVYSLAFAVSAPLVLFSNMKLRSLYVTSEKNNFNEFLSARKIISILIFFILLFITILLYPEYLFIITIIGLSKIFDLQSEILYALPHKKQHMELIGKLMIIKHLIMFISFFLSLYLYEDLLISLSIQLILQILFLYFVEKRIIIKIYYENSLTLKFKNVINVIKVGLPLGFVQLIVSFNTSYPRYVLEEFESTEILGYFSAIAYILIVGNIMMSAISQNFISILAKKAKNKDYTSFKKILYSNLSFLSLVVGVSGIAFSYFLGEKFLSIVYGSEYAAYSDILILMSIVLAINCFDWNFDTAFLAIGYLSIQPKISLFMLAINLIVGYVFIFHYGVYGAAFSLIGVSIIQVLSKYYFINKKLNHLMKC